MTLSKLSTGSCSLSLSLSSSVDEIGLFSAFSALCARLRCYLLEAQHQRTHTLVPLLSPLHSFPKLAPLTHIGKAIYWQTHCRSVADRIGEGMRRPRARIARLLFPFSCVVCFLRNSTLHALQILKRVSLFLSPESCFPYTEFIHCLATKPSATCIRFSVLGCCYQLRFLRLLLDDGRFFFRDWTTI